MNTLHTAVVAQATLPSPLGPMLFAATARGLAGCWFTDQAHHPGDFAAPEAPDNRFIAQAAREFDGYWGDAVGARFRVALDPQGTAFQQAVWLALRAIAVGATTSYGTLARGLGRPLAMRAVGAAVGRNPLSIIVPCHRVLGSDGSLTGYAGGLPRKIDLLRREGNQLAEPRPSGPRPARAPQAVAA
jgi:methylated-DNA-[protein]-cysteine S-methyltransferase